MTTQRSETAFFIGIVAHPDRAEMVRRLCDTVQSDVICWDDGEHPNNTTGGCASTTLAVLNEMLTLPVAYTWATVLEDDAVPVPDFRKHLAAALEYAPAPVVGLYLGTGHRPGETQQQIRQAVTAAKDANRAWIMADCLIGSVGYAIRFDLLADMVEFITARDEELPLRITRWAQDRGVAICYTQPSLVDHEDNESIGRPWRGPNFPKRRAWFYGTRACWCTGTVKLGHCPIWSKE